METIHLRPLTLGDRRLLLEWRNDPTTYRSFFMARPVTPAEHSRWLDDVLLNPGKIGLIAEIRTDAVGVLRYDRQGEGRWEVSVTVAPASRGCGVGLRILQVAEKWICMSHPGWEVLTARVLASNAASLRLFVSAGFDEVANHGEVLHLERRLRC